MVTPQVWRKENIFCTHGVLGASEHEKNAFSEKFRNLANFNAFFEAEDVPVELLHPKRVFAASKMLSIHSY